MKFRKGSKVEVLQKAGAPFGSWRPAKIDYGNGHTYLVSYDPSSFDDIVAVERVPRKAMRPSPPLSDGPLHWVTGDILEVFDSYSWKIAEVVRLLGLKYYVVKILGSSQELTMHASSLRSRQFWQDGKWVTLPKDSARLLRSQTKGENFGQELIQTSRDTQFRLKNKNVSRGTKRKSSDASAFPNQRSQVTKRFQTSYRDGRCLHLPPGSSVHLMEKVDAVDSPCLMLGEKHMHDSLNNRANGFPKTNLAIVNPDIDYRYPTVATHDSDTDSVLSSVGSCDLYGHSYRQARLEEDDIGDICSRIEDAEASVSVRESPLPIKDELRVETHLLELHAYRATLLALYASGSISWEQEALITNLRLTLNISTDEHLTELRNLTSSAVHSR